ncbi:hypothetical protein RIF29_24089 [Crotalaria pallida]|uniref:DUF7745 domain-containing protein n=1 Tax=Crotalaria pallida TaxID=3830 RepID=A0AAN9EP92_CROPI
MNNQPGSASNVVYKKNIKMEITKNNMQSLLNMISSIPHEIQVKFTKKYGRLLDLMRVTVNESALSALGQYWNPDLRIFKLPHLDTCPTIEEYESLLKMKIPKLDLVYHHSNLDASEKKLQNLLKLKPKASDRVECREHKGLKRKFLENCLNELIQQQDWDGFMPVYALTIYGKEEWQKEFNEIEPKTYGWRCPWIKELHQENESMKNYIEAMRNDLTLSRRHANQGWSAVEHGQNSLNIAREEVEQLNMKVEYLERKLWEYSRDIEEQEMWLENWELEAKGLKADKDAWRKKYQQLSNSLILYGTTWLGRYEDSFHELRENIQFKMLPKLDHFYKCSKRMAIGLKSWRDNNYLEN